MKKSLTLIDVYKRQGQQLLLGAYSALSRQVNVGTVKLYTRYEMQDVVIVDGRARGIIAKNLVTGELERFAAHAVVIATGGYEMCIRDSHATLVSGSVKEWKADQCFTKTN